MSKELETLNLIKKYQVCTNYDLDEYKTIGEVLPNSFRIIETFLRDTELLRTELLGLEQELNLKNNVLEIIKEVVSTNLLLHMANEYNLEKNKMNLLKEILEK